jgi:putative spermidine/putrescine transport system substrate-binding protein
MTRKLDRRQFTRLALGGTAAAFTVTTLPRTGAAAGELTIIGWGGAHEDSLKKAVYEPFSAATGIRIKSVSVTNQLAGLKAQVQANNPEWDIIQPASLWVARGAKEGLYEKIDYSGIDTSALYRAAVHPYAVAFEVFAVDIVYNTKKFTGGSHPKSWPELWDLKRFSGRRTAPGWTPRDNLEAAVMAGGVPTSKVYPIDTKLAFDKLAELKPSAVWWQTGAQFVQLMADGEVDLGYGWGARMAVIAKEGKPVAAEFNQAILDHTFYAVSKISRNKADAMKFVAFAVQTKPQMERPKLYPQGPTNKKALAELDAKTRADLLNPEMPNVVVRDHDWWVDREEDLIGQWKRFLAG